MTRADRALSEGVRALLEYHKFDREVPNHELRKLLDDFEQQTSLTDAELDDHAPQKPSDYELGFRVELMGDRTLEVDLLYPGLADHPTRVSLGLEAVRAVDNLTIEFCFDRNAWVISREVFRENEGGLDSVTGLVELVLIPAWTEDSE